MVLIAGERLSGFPERYGTEIFCLDFAVMFWGSEYVLIFLPV